MEPVSVRFVLSDELADEGEASEVMLQAYEACMQNKVNTLWVREKDINVLELKRTDVIVFEKFDGKDFKCYEEKQSAVVGPWCLIVCLMEGKKIPNFQWPIFNVAMYNCVITSSHLPKSTKIAIGDKVRTMGGFYTDTQKENTTHLITDSVKSEKYASAVQRNIKIVTPSWVDAVWQASQNSNVHCNDEKFDKYKCPPFHKLIISITGSTSLSARNKLEELITANGGKYTPKLELINTDFLICDGIRGTMSEKYKEARKTKNIQCVTTQWLYDSVKKGYCLPQELYPVEKGTSTPTKDEHVNPDFSTMSAINQSRSDITSVNESHVPDVTSQSIMTSVKGSKRKIYAEFDLIDQLDLKKAKKSGQFLDGCSVYLVGFKSDHREKLSKIINASGATRCDDMSDRVTHVVVGDSECHEFKLIKSKNYSCSLITVQWLLDSIEKRGPCNEEPYLINNDMNDPTFKSPLGQKGLNLLRSNKTITEVDVNLSQQEIDNRERGVATEEENAIMKQYLPSQNTEDDTLAKYLKQVEFDSNQLGDQSTLTSQTESQPLKVFTGLTFFICNFEDDQIVELRDQICIGSGRVINSTNKADYILSPCFITETLEFDQERVINDIWVYECLSEEKLVPIDYYHRPLFITENEILENCVVTISVYTGFERNFLMALIEKLGGTAQEQFARIASMKKNILGSTHLVTAEANGRKYEAAIKWGLPAVSKEWLIDCAKQYKRLNEKDYFVSDEVSKSEASNCQKTESNKENKSAQSHIENATAQSSTSALITTPQIKKTASRDVDSFATKSSAQESYGTSTNRAITEFEMSAREAENDDSFTIPAPKKFPTPRSSSTRNSVSTPETRRPEDFCSQVTPVDKIMREARMLNFLGTPDSPQLSKAPWDVDTPQTPYGAFIDPNPSKTLKKDMMRYLNQFPDKLTPPPRRKSTPLSELKRKLWEKIGSSMQSQEESVSDNVFVENRSESVEQPSTQSTLVNSKLHELEQVFNAANASTNKTRRQSKQYTPRRDADPDYNARESQQPCSVQWNFGGESEQTEQNKVFMISGVNNEERKGEILTRLVEFGAQVSSSSSYDPECTHLLCPKPSRNEKILSCMAAGKWILHINYLDACAKAGKFLNEEEYEFGNPNSIGKIPVELDRDLESRMQAIHYWRKENARTGRGPFYDMRAIVVAEKKQALISVIEAGGGTVIDAQPPFNDIVHATHCLIEARSANNFSLYEPLAKQGIYCVNTLYISEFLHRKNKDIKESVLPFFQKYFN